jgi:hypothetical protein
MTPELVALIVSFNSLCLLGAWGIHLLEPNQESFLAMLQKLW